MRSKTKATSMNDDAKAVLVPGMRFPEFRGAEGWVQRRLGTVLSFQTGYPFPSSGFNDKKDGMRLIRNRDLRSDDIVVFYSGEIDPSFVVQDGDVLVGMDGDFTPIVWEKGEALLNQRVGRILPQGSSDLRFLLYLLTLSLKKIEEKTARTTVKHLSHSVVGNKDEPLPTLAEQRKIADCLSSLDELIAAQARKVDALKTHKKGLMQQLFPREGETQPRRRFPEFQNAGDWEVKKIEDIARRGSGHTPNKAKPEYYNGGIKWVSLADSKRLDNGKIFETATLISELGIKNSSAVLHPAGSVILSRDAGVGKSAVLNESMAVSQHFVVWTCDNRSLSNWFLYYFLQFNKPVFENVATGSTIKTIGLPFFKELCITIPSVPEQQCISSSLSDLDALITAETQKLETLKTHKKGLMQQLFPSVGGVAGEA